SGRNRIGRSVWPWWHPIVAPTAPTEHRMTAYLIAKTAHIVFVIAWMAALFYLPRILLNLVEAGDAPPVLERLLLMGRRLYRFGHVMLGLAFVRGRVRWLGSRVRPASPTRVPQGRGGRRANRGVGLRLLRVWVGCRAAPDVPPVVAQGSGWLHAKLGLVLLLFAVWVVSGRWLKRVMRGGTLPSASALRWFNEIPVLVLAGIVWLVLAKPF